MPIENNKLQKPTKPGHHRQPLLMLTKVLIGIYVVYFLASFAFLNLVLVRWVNSSNDEILIHHRWAYSPWPGRVVVRNFSFRLQDSNVQMYFEMPRLVVQVGIPGLFQRQLNFSRVNANELRFFFRFRRSAEALKNISLSTLPSIPGLESLEKTPSKPSTGEFNPWKVDLKNLFVERMTELWFEEFHFRGETSLKGGFYLFPKTKVEIFPTTLNFGTGTVEVDNAVVAENLQGLIEGSVERFDPDKVPGFDIFKSVSAQIQLKSPIEGLGFLNHYFRNRPEIRFTGGKGTGEIQLGIQKGVWTPESRLLVEVQEAEARLWKQKVKGKGKIFWQITADAKNLLQVTLSDFRLTASDEPRYPVTGHLLNLGFKSNDTQVGWPPEDLNWDLEIPQAKVHNLRYVNTYLPHRKDLFFLGGNATLKVSLHVKDGGKMADEGTVSLAAEGASFQLGKAKIRGDLKLKAGFERSNLKSGNVLLARTLLEGSRFIPEGQIDSAKPWKLRAHLQNSRFKIGKGGRFAGRFYVEATNAKPFFAVLTAESKGLPSWITKIFPLTDLTVSGQVDVQDEELAFTHVSLDSKNAAILGWLATDPVNRTNARFLFKAAPFAVGFESIEGDPSIKLHEAENWFYGRKPSP